MDCYCDLDNCIIIYDHDLVTSEPDVIQFVVDKGNNSTAQVTQSPRRRAPLAALLINTHNLSSKHQRFW